MAGANTSSANLWISVRTMVQTFDAATYLSPDLRVTRHVDALDIDLGRDLPEHARLPRTHQVQRTAVEADDGDLVGLGLDRFEHLGGEIRPRRLEHRMAVGRKLGANHLVQLDRKAAQRIEQTVPARLEHLLEPAVAHEEGALAVLDRHAQR